MESSVATAAEQSSRCVQQSVQQGLCSHGARGLMDCPAVSSSVATVVEQSEKLGIVVCEAPQNTPA